MIYMEFSVASKLLDACVLGVVAAGDTYGYDLTQKIGNTIEISETALYPVLRRLSKEGFLTTYDKAHDGRNRKYYTITPTGKTQFEYYKSAWENYKQTVDTILIGGNT